MSDLSKNQLMDLYLNPQDDTDESIEEYLEWAGINEEKIMEKFQKLLKKKKAEIKLEKGKEIKNTYDEFYNRVKNGELFLPQNEPELVYAHRKLDENEGKDYEALLSDAEKILILTFLQKQTDK